MAPRLERLAKIDAALHVLDPDGGRVRSAAAVTIATALAAGATALAPGLTAAAPMIAGALAMMAASTVVDGTAREERLTFAMLFVPLTVGLGLGVALTPFPVLSLAGFVAIASIAVSLQRFGPRGTASGTLLFNGYFFALFFRARPEEVTSVLVPGWIALGVAALVRVLAHGERASSSVRRLRRALPVLAARVLETHAPVVRRGDLAPHARRSALQRLNEATLLLDDQLEREPALAALSKGTRRAAFELELAAERVGANVLALSRGEPIAEAAQEAIERAIRAAERALLGDDDDGATARAIDDARRAVHGAPHLELAVVRLGDSLASVLHAAQPSFEPAASAAPSLPPSAPKALPSPGLHPTTRQAIQVAIATALSVVVGRAISEERWFWAAVAAYLVIAPASTRGEILVRAWRRTLGTTIGVAMGIVVALLVSGHARVELALLFVCVFLGMVSRKTSYTLVVLWLTTALALLYELTGRYSVDLLALRFEETVAGAAIGALAAALVLPTHTGTRLEAALVRFATLFADDLDDLSRALGEHEGASRARVRAIDRALVEVRTAAEPLTRGGYRLGASASTAVRACSTLAFYARQMAMPGLLARIDHATPELDPVLHALAQNSRALAKLLTTREAAPPVPVPLEALRGRADRDREGDEPRDLDLAVLCAERMTAALAEVRAALSH